MVTVSIPYSCGGLTAQTGQPIAFSQLMLLKFSSTATTIPRLFIFKHILDVWRFPSHF